MAEAKSNTDSARDEYAAFLESKTRRTLAVGFDCRIDAEYLFPFQRVLTEWALRRGRAAIFAATGLGKTRMEIEWARRVSEHSGGRVLILCPLAVAAQTETEGAKIGVSVKHCRDGNEIGSDRIIVTNYDRIHRFDVGAFGGVVLDEASILKAQDGATRRYLTDAFAATPYRLSATATPSPNDYTELGTQSEFLGAATRTEMLSEYFVHDGGETQKWRLKRHARSNYWAWVSSWAALVQKPSDLGFDDTGYDLPPLNVRTHVLPADQEEVYAAGRLFAAVAGTLSEQRVSRKATLDRRVSACADLVNAEPGERWIVWGDLNSETEALARSIHGAVEVRGSDSVDEKEARLLGFVRGDFRVLVSKASICGHGLNFQHCARMAFVGVNHSFEGYHQAVRRVWRFGQTRPVDVHMFASEMDEAVLDNLRRKEDEATKMADELRAVTRDEVRRSVLSAGRPVELSQTVRVGSFPRWLQEEL